MFTVADVMSRSLVTLQEQQTLEEARAALERAHIRHLPVVRGRQLVGLLTHRDLLEHCQHEAPVRAAQAMTRDVTTVRPTTPVREAIQLMLTNKFGCLPVTTEGNELLGILTESDLLRVAAERAEEIDLRESAHEY